MTLTNFSWNRCFPELWCDFEELDWEVTKSHTDIGTMIVATLDAHAELIMLLLERRDPSLLLIFSHVA